MTTNFQSDSASMSEAADEIEAAVSEGQRGKIPFSISLLLDAAEKERASLGAIEESLDSLLQSIDERRKAIDQQEELLRDLASSI